MNLTAIGTIKSPETEGVDENWGEVIAEIQLDEALAAGLQGLEEFSHILVIFYIHQSQFDSGVNLVRRPRGREDMPLLGIFAQRAKHRPNPIGITAVRLLSVKGSILRVQGLDASDGTSMLPI